MHNHEAGGECCRPKHDHHHEHSHDHHVIKGIGSACMSGACGHVEHMAGVSSIDLQRMQEQLLAKPDLESIDDNEEETDPITGKKKRKARTKFKQLGALAGTA